MQKIKIISCFLTEGGGTGRYQMSVLRFLDREKFQMDFCSIKKRVSNETALAELGSKVHCISCFAEEDETKFRSEFAEIIKGYDVLHLHTNHWKTFVCEEVGREVKIPKIIIHAHNSAVGALRDLDREAATKRHYRVRDLISPEYADEFVGCSKAAAEFVYGEKVPKEKIHILHNGIDSKCFSFNEAVRDKARAELGLESKFVILAAGRLVYQKNFSFLFDAFSKFTKAEINTDDAVLAIAGVGDSFDELTAQCKDLGITEQVKFLGFCPDIAKLYNMADLFVLPSLFEGLGIVAVEAQCSGLKSLLSDGVPEEAVITGLAERLPLDADLWANKIAAIYKSGYERRDRSDDVRAAGYEMSEQVKVLENLYAE
jgi:glycosyltransferase involved in cell wall biosynthesis